MCECKVGVVELFVAKAAKLLEDVVCLLVVEELFKLHLFVDLGEFVFELDYFVVVFLVFYFEIFDFFLLGVIR